MINQLVNIFKEKGKDFIIKLFNSYVVISEQIDGSRFLFQKDSDGNFIYYKKDFEPITYIDRTLMCFYEKAIQHINNLPDDVKDIIPNNWVFGFQYFPSSIPINIKYDKIPKNHLILTDISIRNESGKVIKSINDFKILNNWANKLDVNEPPIIFSGRLNETQKQQLLNFLDTPINDLIEIFKTKSFTRYIISILNPSLNKTTLMNDLEKPIEGIIFKFINPGKTDIVSAKIVDPIFYYKSKNVQNKPRKSSDIYQIIMLDIIEFIEQLDLSKYNINGTNNDEKYVDLISRIFNDYVSENGYKYIGINFETPEFAKDPSFDINLSFIKNQRTKELIQNQYLKDLYKIMLSSFRKYRKQPTNILTQGVIDTINTIIDKINLKINEIEPQFDEALDFTSFLKKIYILENKFENQITEGLNLKTKEHGLKKVNIVVGRFQPFTLGHIKIFKSIHEQNKLPIVVLLVKNNKKRNKNSPFDEDLQIRLFSEMKKEYDFLESIYVITSASIDLIFNELRPTYEPVLWGTGSDRIKSYQKMIDKYKDEINVLDEFSLYKIHRTDEDISATKVRNALLIDDIETFKKMTPKSIHKFYDELKQVIEQVHRID